MTRTCCRWTSSWSSRAVSPLSVASLSTSAWWTADTLKGTGLTDGNDLRSREVARVVKEGYERCVSSWEKKHKKCVDTVIR